MVKAEPLKRKITDPLVYSNILFIFAAYTPYVNKNYELTILTCLGAIFSTLYHYYRERRYVFFEYKLTKFNYLYCIVQIFYCSTQCYFKIELLLSISTFVVFLIVGRLRLLSYQKYHILQHILPSIWIFIGGYKKPFLI